MMNALKKFLPSKLPIIQGPMVGSFSPLTIAVCEAGGLGSLACAALTPDSLREQITAIRTGTTAPFNINFFSHSPPAQNTQAIKNWIKLLSPYYAEIGLDLSSVQTGPGRAPFDDAMCRVIEEARPAVVSFHFGLPETSLLNRVRQTGAMIFSSATSVKEALWLEARGVDAIIAQGNEAGGHRGMFLTSDIHAQPGLFALLPQIVDAVRVPVIAAGGIADGRGIAAALALGASAAQIGTAYLLTPEAGRSAIHKQAIKDAQDDSTRVTNLYTGRPARGLLTRFMREQGPMNSNAPAFSLATGAVDPLKSAFEKAGKNDFSQLWAGEAASLAREIDAEELTKIFWQEARLRLTQLTI